MKKPNIKPVDSEAIKNKLTGAVKSAESAATGLVSKTKDAVTKTQATIVNAVDANGNGEIDVEDIIIWGIRTPGVGVDRAEFLKKEFMKNYPQQVVEDAIANNPAHAGIPRGDIDKIADEVIKFERNCVSGISAALGMPGGFAMAATIPADIAQYYGYMLRAAQKLMYLYGFPQLETGSETQQMDSETMNILIICLGAMYGVQGASAAIKTMARMFGEGVEKKLLKTALTKGTIYPIVKNVARWFNVNMTKQMFAGFFKKAIPVVGGVIGGGITYATFKPCCDRLKESLRDTMLSNPEHEADDTENIVFEEV